MDRKAAEMEFHDQRELDRKTMSEDAWLQKYSNKRWYSTTAVSRKFINGWIETHVVDRTVLDFGCGLGGMSVRMAKAGAAKVHAIDISPESVKTTRDAVASVGLADRLDAQVMDAENMTYPDNVMDVIVASGVLHHMDTARAIPELARVLKPGGTVIAIEPLAYNPLINMYRKRTPQLRTEWEAEHILKKRDIDVARACFEQVDIRYFHLASIGAAFLQKTPFFAPALSVGNAIDSVLLRIPGIRLMAWQMVILMSKPKGARV